MLWDGSTAPAPLNPFYPMTDPQGRPWAPSLGVNYTGSQRPPCAEHPCPYSHGDVYAAYYGGFSEPLGVLVGANGNSVIAETETGYFPPETWPGYSQAITGCVLRMKSQGKRKLRVTLTGTDFTLATDRYCSISLTASVVAMVRVPSGASATGFVYLGFAAEDFSRSWSNSSGEWSGNNEFALPIFPRYALAVYLTAFSILSSGDHGVYGPNSGKVRVDFTEVD